MRRLEKVMPSDGTIHMLVITDKQYESIKTFYCGTKKRLTSPDQLLLF